MIRPAPAPARCPYWRSFRPSKPAIKRSIYRLGVLTGQQPAALESELAPAAPIPALPSLVNIGDPASLLRRPDIRSAESALAAATARIGVATSDLFPRVPPSMAASACRPPDERLSQGGADTYSFGPSITWGKYLDIGHVRARIKAANARADGQLAAYDKTVLNALEETEDALVDFGREQVRRDYLRTSERSATEAMTLARQRYDGGIDDFLTVLDAQRAQLLQSRPNWHRAKPAPPPASSPSTRPWAAAGKSSNRRRRPRIDSVKLGPCALGLAEASRCSRSTSSPLTPALSPRERENHQPRRDKSRHPDISRDERASALSPKGEGRGEGGESRLRPLHGVTSSVPS